MGNRINSLSNFKKAISNKDNMYLVAFNSNRINGKLEYVYTHYQIFGFKFVKNNPDYIYLNIRQISDIKINRGNFIKIYPWTDLFFKSRYIYYLRSK